MSRRAGRVVELVGVGHLLLRLLELLGIGEEGATQEAGCVGRRDWPQFRVELVHQRDALRAQAGGGVGWEGGAARH